MKIINELMYIKKRILLVLTWKTDDLSDKSVGIDKIASKQNVQRVCWLLLASGIK